MVAKTMLIVDMRQRPASWARTTVRDIAAAALDGVRYIAIPTLAHENVEPALAAIGC